MTGDGWTIPLAGGGDPVIRGCKVFKSGPAEWTAYVPPTGRHAYDIDGWSLLGPYGDSYWPSHESACTFVELAQRTEAKRRQDYDRAVGLYVPGPHPVPDPMMTDNQEVPT